MTRETGWYMTNVVIALLAILQSGCLTILQGTTQDIPVSSDPPGATVSTGDVTVIAPSTLTLKRKTSHVLTFSKDGYKPETVKLESLPIFTDISWSVDAMTGAESRLSPKSVHVVLVKPIEAVDVSFRGPPKAEVWVNEQARIFDSSGVLLMALKPGTYHVVVSKIGFDPWEGPLIVEAGKPLIHTISLTPVKLTPSR